MREIDLDGQAANEVTRTLFGLGDAPNGRLSPMSLVPPFPVIVSWRGSSMQLRTQAEAYWLAFGIDLGRAYETDRKDK